VSDVERIAIGEFTMPPRKPATPPTHWAGFDTCPRCHAKTGEACLNMRDYHAGTPRVQCKTVTLPHPGRKQLGPKAGRSIYLR
jgi:hypothetical protein